MSHGYDPTFGDLMGGGSGTAFVYLAAGGAMSGIAGGVLLYLLLRPTPETRSA